MNEIEQKAIEEMAKESGGCNYPHRRCENCWCREAQECSAYAYAKSFYDAGYRNVKDKVVLSKQEYERLSIFQFTTAQQIMSETRKETAKKIYSFLVEYYGCDDWNLLLHNFAQKFDIEVDNGGTEN